MHRSRDATAIAALADGTRRSLYDFVASSGEVSRDQAAAALGLAKHTVSFHLDRLAAEGLLEVDFRRLSGRVGPGAGRPSKLYRRAREDFAVSVPPRRYDLVGDILAGAVSRAAEGVELDAALAACAHEEGVALAREARPPLAEPALGDALGQVAEVLADQGYEPSVEQDAVVLANCPFDVLAQKHTAVVCGLNQAFVQGVADGLQCSGVVASLEPHTDRCCVTVRQTMADDSAALERWITSGGHWEVLAEHDGQATVGLFTCDGGEEMDRLVLPVAALPDCGGGPAGTRPV